MYLLDFVHHVRNSAVLFIKCFEFHSLSPGCQALLTVSSCFHICIRTVMVFLSSRGRWMKLINSRAFIAILKYVSLSGRGWLSPIKCFCFRLHYVVCRKWPVYLNLNKAIPLCYYTLECCFTWKPFREMSRDIWQPVFVSLSINTAPEMVMGGLHFGPKWRKARATV